MLKIVQKQLLLIFIIAVFILILNSTIYFNLTKKKFWLSLVNMALTITSIAIFLVLIISINMGLLNDPDLSKAIRLFILFEFFLQIVSFIFNIIIPFLLYDYLYKLCYNSCKTCDINGNDTYHNCIECNDNYNYESNFSNYKN